MIAASNSDLLIAKLAVGGIAAVFFWRLIVWVRDAPVTPDPWDAATEEKLSAPEIEQTVAAIGRILQRSRARVDDNPKRHAFV